MESISELRRDIVSGDWVVIATGRSKRPHDFLLEKRPLFRQPKSGCPFDALYAEALLVHSRGATQDKKKWWVEVIPNKFPAFRKGECPRIYRKGLYQLSEGVGFHEVVITNDHIRSIAQMSHQEVELLMRSYQDRYLALKGESCVKYISIFHNHGRGAGATLSHPHSQIIAIPVVPPDIARSIKGSAEYFRAHKRCVHCLILRYELRVKERIIYQNELFLACTPFASKTAFEMRIFPKRHESHFENMAPGTRRAFADALRVTLAKLFRGLKNPDYNFFLHTAPASGPESFLHYHWHLEILPKTAIWAGFEIGTGIEISTIAPEDTAGFLRKIKINE